MTLTPRSYPAKVLLFGEYVIIRGASALAIPYRDFEGHWAVDPGRGQDPELAGLLAYLEEKQAGGELLAPMDLPRMKELLAEGLFFESTIPVGYGLGSSGALVAAVYEAFCTQPPSQPGALQAFLAQIESYFHGASSGADPLVCLLEQPLLLRSRQDAEAVSIPASQDGGKSALFLIDTGIKRETGPLVRIFLSKCEDLGFDSRVEDGLGGMSNAAIRAFLRADWPILLPAFAGISKFQWDHFQEMIPDSIKPVWEKGLKSTHYKVKLCGAGGGGFLLGIAADFEAAARALEGHALRVVMRW